MIGTIALAREIGFSPGIAAKLYGVVNFMETGMFSRVGGAGLNSIKERQYGEGSRLTDEILSAFDTLECIIKMQPRREYSLWAGMARRATTASDAAYEGRKGTQDSCAFPTRANPRKLDLAEKS